MMSPRHTLASPATISGTGLFTARPATLTIGPAETGGLVFRRVDLPGAPTIPARIAGLAQLPGLPAGMQARNTTLAAGPAVFITTTEHVLSALAGMGVTEALIDIDGPEVPILDGSAVPFADAVLRVGLRELASGAPVPALPRSISISAGPASISAVPRDQPGCRLEYRLDYGPGAPIPPQSAAIELDPGEPGANRYTREIAPARTFCLAAEARAMHEKGLFGHMTPRDMVVVGDDGKPIDNAWRFPDEPARHKLLDLIGDLALAGSLPRATIVARRSGHAENQALAKALVEALGV